MKDDINLYQQAVNESWMVREIFINGTPVDDVSGEVLSCIDFGSDHAITFETLEDLLSAKRNMESVFEKLCNKQVSVCFDFERSYPAVFTEERSGRVQDRKE